MNDTKPIWTPEHAERLKTYLDREDYTIPVGLGTKEAACSMAAINLAWNGGLRDVAPPCMSQIIGHWILMVQDECFEDVRNSREWRRALLSAPGTGRDDKREDQRFSMLRNWALSPVLESLLPVAVEHGFKLKMGWLC